MDDVIAASSVPCGCEAYRASSQSPGPVADDEVLNFLLSDPGSHLQNGTLNPAIVQPAIRSGLSVLRDRAADSEFEVTLNQLNERWKPKQKAFSGVQRFSAAAVRDRSLPGVWCVYDTALPEKPNHADIMAGAKIEAMSNSQRTREERALQKALIDRIGANFVPAATFRSGAFSA